MKEYMMEAMKRKRAMMKEKSKSVENDELAPVPEEDEAHEAAESPAMEKKEHGMDESQSDDANGMKQVMDSQNMNENVTALGQSGGLQKTGKKTSPENSKNLFVDPKKDLRDPVDLNRHRNMAGDGSNSKYDTMGVDDRVEVSQQASKQTAFNAAKTAMMKEVARKDLAKKVKLPMVDASKGQQAGMDAPDSLRDNTIQPGYKVPMSDVNRAGDPNMQWDQDKEGAQGKYGAYDAEGSEFNDEAENQHKMRGIKGAKARLNGFLDGMKKKKA